MKNVGKNPLKINVACQKSDVKMKIEHHPCLCEVAELVLFFSRLFGIAPIAHTKPYSHGQKCKFEVSKHWKRFGVVQQACFCLYAIILHGIRLWCGPTISNKRFWYVMTIGFIINDLSAICCMVAGTISAQKLCKIFEMLASLNGSVKQMKQLKTFMKKIICLVSVCYLITLGSYIYVACLRSFALDVFFENNCNLPDYPFAVIIRGFGLIFPVVEQLIITLLCSVIQNKFQDLMEKTDLTIATSSTILITTIEVPYSLDHLASDHKQISLCLKELNSCFGLQLLAMTSSVLYTTIYFLYRYSISSSQLVFSNTNERIHYIVGVCYRMGNLLHYMYLGRQMNFWSQAPLKVLQNSDLLNLPSHMQQQVQTLMLQWSGKVGNLSAMEVINVGPWLLAPIVGNVITYLLVALQFENSNRHYFTNMTIPSIFEAYL